MPHITFTEFTDECTQYRAYLMEDGDDKIGVLHCAPKVVRWLDQRVNIQSRAGSVTSAAKTKASRRNGKKGGRPALKKAKKR